MAKVKTEIEQTGEGQQSEWVNPEAEAIFNALLLAYPKASQSRVMAPWWKSMLYSLRELYPSDMHIMNAWILKESGIVHQDQPKEIPAKPAKQPSEYRKEPDYSAKAGRETSGECESCG